MSHLHSMYDNDTHFKIDPVTRQIKNESDKVILMQNDHNSERFTFEISRYIDGHDMSLCNKVEVHFINLKADKTEKNADVYTVEDLQISPNSDDVVICSWLISQNATKHAGSLNFVLRYACLTGEVIDYQWYTDIHKGISVSESISNTAYVATEYSDVLETWRRELLGSFGGSVDESKVKEFVYEYLEENPPSYGKDGLTPHIGANGNWFLGETDTGVKAQGGNGQGGAFYVTVSDSKAGGYTTDKTYAEIKAAYEAGSIIYALGNTEEITAGTYGEVPLILSLITFDDNGGNGFIFSCLDYQTQTTIFIEPNGNVSISRDTFPTTSDSLKNPKALTVNGTSYDGSVPVDLTNVINNMIVTKLPTDTNSPGESAIPSYVKSEAGRVAALVQSHQNANTLTFIASSDAHLPISSHAQYENVNNGLIHAGQAMDLIRKQIHSDFSFYTGDMIWDIGETAETAMASMRYVHEVLSNGFSDVQFWGRGNHENGYESGANLNEAQIFANVGKWNTGAVFNPEDRIGGYCYRDFEDYKVRVICINTGDGGTNISAKQNGWLAEALNVPVEDGWGTILLSHCPPDWLSGSATETSLLMQTIKAASGIICCIHGHTHCYQIGTVTGTTIPRIAVPNLCFARSNEYGKSGNSFGDTTTYDKTANSAKDTAFAVITIDRASGTAYVDYYGARPEDTRTVNNLPTWKSKQIVNLVPTSQQKGSTAVYNGVGYKNGAYPSDSGSDGSDSATVVTGWIPYNNEVIYIKGATLDTTKSHVRWRSYFSNKTDSLFGDGSNMGNYFTIETLGDMYYRLTPKTTITNSAYYRISLVGTGENLIITHDQPIE